MYAQTKYKSNGVSIDTGQNNHQPKEQKVNKLFHDFVFCLEEVMKEWPPPIVHKPTLDVL